MDHKEAISATNMKKKNHIYIISLYICTKKFLWCQIERIHNNDIQYYIRIEATPEIDKQSSSLLRNPRIWIVTKNMYMKLGTQTWRYESIALLVSTFVYPYPCTKSVTRSFDVFFDLHLNKKVE